MKTNTKNTTNHGFTLIEMVGVLAVIAILAALLVPKIFAAINDSRFSSSVSTINSCKTATMDYFGKKGSFPSSGAPATAFDKELVKENCLERPLACKLAEGSANAEVVTLATSGVANGGYKLDGTTALTGGQVVQIKLVSVAGADAYELSRRIDGNDLSATAVAEDLTANPPVQAVAAENAPDSLGRVVYAAPDADGKTTVYIYLAHK